MSYGYTTKDTETEHDGAVPTLTITVEGTHDISRMVNLLASGNCEQGDLQRRIVRSLRRLEGGRAALDLLKRHGGPDFTAEPPSPPEFADRLRANIAEHKPLLDRLARGGDCLVCAGTPGGCATHRAEPPEPKPERTDIVRVPGWYCGHVGCSIVGEHEHNGGIEAAPPEPKEPTP